MQEAWVRSLRQENPLEKEMAACSSLLSGKSHGQRSLEGCSPWGHRELDVPKRLCALGSCTGEWVSRWPIPSYSLLVWLAHSFCLAHTPCCHLFIPNSWTNSYFPFIHTLYSMKFQLCLLGKVDISKSKLGVESDAGSCSRGQSGRGMRIWYEEL